MPNRVARSIARNADSVMFSVQRRAGSARRQEVRLSWPLKGMIDPKKDVPIELRRFRQINFNVCPILARPETRPLLAEAVEAFKSGGMVMETDRFGLIKDTWANISELISGQEATFTFKQNSFNHKVYLRVSSGNGLIVVRRLFLGRL